MGWEAHTTYKSVGAGTGFRIVESPTIRGEPPLELPVGANLPISHPDGLVTKARVVRASSVEADIELADGTIWRMTPATDNDFPVSISTGTLHAKNWVVRSKIP